MRCASVHLERSTDLASFNVNVQDLVACWHLDSPSATSVSAVLGTVNSCLHPDFNDVANRVPHCHLRWKKSMLPTRSLIESRPEPL